MNRLDELLEYIRITNPQMTKERMIEEMSKCDYATLALNNTYEQTKRDG